MVPFRRELCATYPRLLSSGALRQVLWPRIEQSTCHFFGNEEGIRFDLTTLYRNKTFVSLNKICVQKNALKQSTNQGEEKQFSPKNNS